jgi:hypothetical protein
MICPGNSVYHGGTLQVNKTASKYFNLNASYTLSHTLDDGTFATFISVPEDAFRRNQERATSNQDARHRFVSNFSLIGPDNNKYLRNFLLSNIVTLQSARPFTLFVGFDANNDLIPAADRVGKSFAKYLQGRQPQDSGISVCSVRSICREKACALKRQWTCLTCSITRMLTRS